MNPGRENSGEPLILFLTCNKPCRRKHDKSYSTKGGTTDLETILTRDIQSSYIPKKTRYYEENNSQRALLVSSYVVGVQRTVYGHSFLILNSLRCSGYFFS